MKRVLSGATPANLGAPKGAWYFCWLIMLAFLAGPNGSKSEDAETPWPSSADPSVINDQDISNKLIQTGERLVKARQAVMMTTLRGQLNRRNCSLRLPAAGAVPMPSVKLTAQNRRGVLVVAEVFKCRSCGRWHANPASGFFLSESGALATCYHVVNSTENGTLVVMTSDGALYPVQEVLAADRETDVAILRIRGEGFNALPLSPAPAPVGSVVRVISHPQFHFYVFTEGVVSRYQTTKVHEREFMGMTITADFAKGSSGAPVFDENGGVAGLVRSTSSIYYSETNGIKDNLQMVLKECVPARYLRELIKTAPQGGR